MEGNLERAFEPGSGEPGVANDAGWPAVEEGAVRLIVFPEAGLDGGGVAADW